MRVREATDADRPALHRFLSERHSAVVARLGRLENALEHPALIAETDDGALAGVLTYQRRGFRLRELHPGAVDESRRRLKPEIPQTGEYGIPMRDEIVLEKEVPVWRP
jgi:hypothetical protein